MAYATLRRFNLIERFRRLISNYDTFFVSPEVQPVLVLNDREDSQIFVLNAERTSNGSTTLLTTNSNPEVQTKITALTLSISDAVVGA